MVRRGLRQRAIRSHGVNVTGYSTDGINWTTKSFAGQWRDITYGNGKFVAVSTNGNVLYSQNGVNWSTFLSLSDFSFQKIAYGSYYGNYLAVGLNSKYILISSDLTNYTTGVIPA